MEAEAPGVEAEALGVEAEALGVEADAEAEALEKKRFHIPVYQSGSRLAISIFASNFQTYKASKIEITKRIIT